MRSQAIAGVTGKNICWLLLALLVLTGCSTIQRKFLFYPSHHAEDNGLAHWLINGQLIGFSRTVVSPKNVWLLLHGNGGQAADRAYALPRFSPDDSIFILEYPGYGARSGTPSEESFDAAASEVYAELQKKFPALPICVAAESIGSGPASLLARQPMAPAKIVLVVPFDTLQSVAAEHAPYLPTRLILGKSWDNIAALGNYDGPIEIFGAEDDTIIPVKHAEALGQSRPQAKFHKIPGGHNDWSSGDKVAFRNP